jgi:hypothetical protein
MSLRESTKSCSWIQRGLKKKQLTALKGNSNRQVNEIRKRIQDMKEKINIDIEILKSNQL